jgi:hypothetical protein
LIPAVHFYGVVGGGGSAIGAHGRYFIVIYARVHNDSPSLHGELKAEHVGVRVTENMIGSALAEIRDDVRPIGIPPTVVTGVFQSEASCSNVHSIGPVLE